MSAVVVAPIIPSPLPVPWPPRRPSVSRQSRTGTAMPSATTPPAAAAIKSAARRLIVVLDLAGSIPTTSLSLLGYRAHRPFSRPVSELTLDQVAGTHDRASVPIPAG